MMTVESIQDNNSAYSFMLELLNGAIKANADDVFIISSFAPSYKISGSLEPQGDLVLSKEQAKLVVLSIMNEEQKKTYQEDCECNFAFVLPTGGRFRVNAYLEQTNLAMVMRKINTEVPTLDILNMPDILKDIALERKGLVIVVGATGSGKSTTLAAMINHCNENSYGHILSIEDPIEFVHKHKKCIVSQREVGVDTKSWHNAIKSALRQAPNVVLIGEIRDAESMEYALQFAETGHLCVATIHATNASQAIERIINLFPPEKQDQVFMNLSLNLKAIIAQRLIKNENQKCRSAAMEILLNTSTVANYIFKKEIETIREIMAKSTDIGMITFDVALFNLYEAGKISYEEALKNADSIGDLKLNIKLNSARQKTITDNIVKVEMQII